MLVFIKQLIDISGGVDLISISFQSLLSLLLSPQLWSLFQPKYECPFVLLFFDES
jgi:hypothetical protein